MSSDFKGLVCRQTQPAHPPSLPSTLLHRQLPFSISVISLKQQAFVISAMSQRSLADAMQPASVLSTVLQSKTKQVSTAGLRIDKTDAMVRP